MRVGLRTEQPKWLRDERQKAYGSLSIAGEEALRFIRNDLVTLIESPDDALRAELDERWRATRMEFRKSFNQVALVGTEDAWTAGRHVVGTCRQGHHPPRLLGSWSLCLPASRNMALRCLRGGPVDVVVPAQGPVAARC